MPENGSNGRGWSSEAELGGAPTGSDVVRYTVIWNKRAGIFLFLLGGMTDG